MERILKPQKKGLFPQRITPKNREDITIFLNKNIFYTENPSIIIPFDFEWFWKKYPCKIESNKNLAKSNWNLLCNKEIKPTKEVLEWALLMIKQIHIGDIKFIYGDVLSFIINECWTYSRLQHIDKQISYKEWLKHPKWQRKRLEIMQRDNFTCCICHRDDIVLNVHHKKYIPNKKPWEYEDINLITLCEDCHSHIHEPQKIKS